MEFYFQNFEASHKLLIRAMTAILNVNEDRFSNHGFPAYDLGLFCKMKYQSRGGYRLTKSGLFVTEGFSFNGHHPSTLLSTVDPCQKVDRAWGLGKKSQKNRPVISFENPPGANISWTPSVGISCKISNFDALLPSHLKQRSFQSCFRRMMMYHHSGFHGFRHHHLYFSLGGLRRNSKL